jgi:hypothetical protein
MKNPFLNKKVKKESVVEKYLTKRATLLGGEVRKVKFLGREGAPDRLVMFPNAISVWVETKSLTGKLRPSQEREHERLRSMGQRVEVIRTEHAVDCLIDEMYAASWHSA